MKFDLHYSLTAYARSGDGRELKKGRHNSIQPWHRAARALKYQKDSEIE
jgi:hypothetical protein